MRNNQDKLWFMQKKFEKIKKIIFKSCKQKKYETCLTAIAVYCNLQYQINQIYCDSDIEELTVKLAGNILPEIGEYVADDNTVLFYDGFGLDLRGWAASYARALCRLNYRVVYVTTSKVYGKIPHITKELGNNIVKYIDMSHSYVDWSKAIFDTFIKYKPKTAFFYTTPNDVSAAVAFCKFTNYVDRFQIDLTDHAYWLGVNAVDYFLESREMGAGLALYKRGVAKEKIIKTDSVPYINRDVFEEELPFDIEKQRYIFTGGALYKTLGDEEHLYYRILDNILDEFKDLKFLYAGYGDDSQIQILIKKYPNRVFLINERPDFYRLIEHCVFYLNSYPMFGGLMMRYAALAKKVPLTLKHEHDADGILENQEMLNIEFDNIEELLNESRRLLVDNEYCKQRCLQINEAVLTEEGFAENLNQIIQNKKSKFVFNEIKLMDTTEFQREYVERFQKEQYYEACATKMNKKICIMLPFAYLRGILIKLRKRMKSK